MMQQPKAKTRHPVQPTGEPIVVSAGWLAKGVGAVVIGALVCVYLTICLLFYQGQWQLVFHPSQAVDRTPASLGLKYEEVRFDATETGHLQLAGWFIAADKNAKYAHATALICHDNVGSLSDTVDLIAQVHALGINVFAFDYRAFGKSDWAKPTESRVYEDADAAYRYLTDSRQIAPAEIVVYGVGLGALAAAHVAATNTVAAFVAVNPLPSGRRLVANDLRTRFIPMRLLFHEHFDWNDVSGSVKTPTLFIKDKSMSCPTSNASVLSGACFSSGHVHELFALSTAPKMYSEFDADAAVRNQTLSRFLDEYVPAK